MRPVSYKQTDPRWANKDYSAPGETTTIGKAGCGPTCMAMVLATLSNPAINPGDTAAWAQKHGYKAKNQGTYYTYFKPQGAVYGIDVVQLNTIDLRKNKDAKEIHDKAVEAIKAGDLVICCMGPGLWTKNGHFILWHELEGSMSLIEDPASASAGRAKAPLSKLQAEVKFYWVVKVPERLKVRNDGVVAVIAEGVRTKGFLKKGTSYVPVREVAEAFGATVSWDDKTSSVTVNRKPIKIINQEGTAIAAARELGDILGVKVLWNEASKTVTFKKG